MEYWKILTNGERWKQYKTRNFYTLSKDNMKVLCSYNTIVGLVIDNTAYITTTKYSITTSKQLTQYCREQNLTRINLEKVFLDNLLKKCEFVA